MIVSNELNLLIKHFFVYLAWRFLILTRMVIWLKKVIKPLESLPSLFPASGRTCYFVRSICLLPPSCCGSHDLSTKIVVSAGRKKVRIRWRLTKEIWPSAIFRPRENPERGTPRLVLSPEAKGSIPCLPWPSPDRGLSARRRKRQREDHVHHESRIVSSVFLRHRSGLNHTV